MIEIIIGTMRHGAFSRKVGNEVFNIYKTVTNDVGLTNYATAQANGWA